MKLEIDTQHIDEVTSETIKLLGKRFSLVEWQLISDAKIDDDNIIRALYEKKQCVLKVVRLTWDRSDFTGYYADVSAEVFYCKTLQDAMDTAKDAIELMLASANKSNA